jgi:hypothetical protein
MDTSAHYLYAVESDFTNTFGVLKLGLTTNPIHRLRQYRTGDAPGCGLLKRYAGLWRVHASSMDELKAREEALHIFFQEKRLTADDGGSCEWFKVTIDEVRTFITTQTFFQNELTVEEVEEIHKDARKRSVPPTQSQAISPWADGTTQLRERFLEKILDGKPFRTIQATLWDILVNLLQPSSTPLQYRGILQWPTGTGKTIGILEIIVLMAEWCKRNGRTYRGLLISPKNDILGTLMMEFQKLSHFGIKVLDGSQGKFSKLTFPTSASTPFLVIATHAAVNGVDDLSDLGVLEHIHYDEVHRITGEQLFGKLKQSLESSNLPLLTGTSATPQTCSNEQRRKIAELFGDPFTLLHKCDVDEAVREGWIAPPRFKVVMLPKLEDRGAVLDAFVEAVSMVIKQKGASGKSIAYIETGLEEARYAAARAASTCPDIHTYTAIDGARTDDKFISAGTDSHHLMFACQRYREGSDIRGLELVAKLCGNHTAVHTLLQICGRALRRDYAEKEGWCVLARPCDKGETEQDVLDSIILDILEFLGKSDKPLEKKEIEAIVRTYMGKIVTSEKECSLEETIDRVQAAYIRREYLRRSPKENYALIRGINAEMGVLSRAEYEERAADHPKFIPDPKGYFRDYWQSWYHFLGVDVSCFPPTKAAWKTACLERGIRCYADYKEKCGEDLPVEPGLLYEDFTNTNEELGWVDEEPW